MKSTQIKVTKNLPNHIAIIMDGNGRWALKRGLSRSYGHKQGALTAEDIIQYANDLGIKYVTLYAFSSENWNRPKEEVDAVMRILERYLKEDVNELIKNDVRISAIGNLNQLPSYLQKSIFKVINKTKNCKKMTITLAISYSSWQELSAACNSIIKECKNGGFSSNIDEPSIKQYLYTKELPDPDLFIRTGGELRLSNFLLMQSSYSELYFAKTLWPDFRRTDLDLAINSFKNRHRRFGTILD